MKKKAARKPAKRKRSAHGGVPDRLRSKMRDNVAQAVTLMIGRPEFEEVLEILKGVGSTLSVAEQQRFAEALDKRLRLLEERRENGELVAPTGRAARKPNDDARADRICKLYRRIRPVSRTNGAALAEVAREFGPASPGRKSDITKQGIRKILKRRGVPCR